MAARPTTLHRLFVLGVIVKGVDGVLECIGGILVVLVEKTHLSDAVIALTQHELIRDPDDRLAHLAQWLLWGTPASAKYFAAGYLLLHGIVKVFLVVQMFREKLWAFPLSIGILGVFVLYQLERLTRHFSWWTLALALLDIAFLWFVWNEYRKAKEGRGALAFGRGVE